MSGSLPKSVATAALFGGMLLTAAAAFAQGASTSGAPVGPNEPSTVSGVVVTAPRTIGRDAATGAAIQLVSMSATVRVADIDPNTPQGAAELDKRVRDAARSMCRELEQAYPVGSPDAESCTVQAIRNANQQVRAAKSRG